MKTRYKYIHFEKDPQIRDKPLYYCKNNKSGDYLGCVSWYPNWRTFVFNSYEQENVYNASCLRDIADFMEQLGKSKKREEQP